LPYPEYLEEEEEKHEKEKHEEEEKEAAEHGSATGEHGEPQESGAEGLGHASSSASTLHVQGGLAVAFLMGIGCL
jgi:hypothetical protein